jgi:hypothetical protein
MKKSIIALAAIPVFCGTAFGTNQGWGIPTGNLAVTTVEAPTAGGVIQSASGYNYTVNAHASFANGGTFDPHGTIGINRYWEGVDLTTGNYTAPTPIATDGKWWPANSGFDKAKGRDYGPYTAGYPGDCTSTSLAVGGYGRETLQLVYNDSNGAHVIASQVIQLYPYSPTQQNPPTVNYFNALSPSGPLLTYIPNVSPGNPPVNVYQGDPPRITAQISNLYPGSTSWLIIYPNDPVSNSTRTGAVTLANSTMTDTTDNGLWSRTFTFDLASALIACGIDQSATGAQTYTVEAIEKLPAVYNNVACAQSQNAISSITFSVDLNFKVDTQLGK